MISTALFELQQDVCRRFGVEHFPAASDDKVGIAENVRSGILPINGLRHMPTDNTTGWYIWAGEQISDAPDFFQPLHAEHVAEWSPAVEKYLGLPPGWRFLVAEDHEDVWFDASLLKV